MSAVETQGSQETSTWVTSFQISYSDDGINFVHFSHTNGNIKVGGYKQWRNNVVKGPWRKQIKGPYFAITVLEGEGKNVAKIRQIIASIILDRDFIILA